jgi:hypothetical protein
MEQMMEQSECSTMRGDMAQVAVVSSKAPFAGYEPRSLATHPTDGEIKAKVPCALVRAIWSKFSAALTNGMRACRATFHSDHNDPNDTACKQYASRVLFRDAERIRDGALVSVSPGHDRLGRRCQTAGVPSRLTLRATALRLRP